MRGSLSGNQSLSYDGGAAYDVPVNSQMGAENYQPKLVAKVQGALSRTPIRYYQVRTKSTVNMTENVKRNMALMGGACALYSSLVSDKSSSIYIACANACPKDKSLRAFIVPILRTALSAKTDAIIASGVVIINPWTSAETPNVSIRNTLLNKFNSELS